MSGAEPPVVASSGSSASVPPPPPLQQQQEEITAAQFSDAIREIIRQQQQQQAISAAQFSDAIREITKHGARSEGDDLRNYLMLVATLTASITYSSMLNPPGGVWQADDATKGYLAGRPVLLDNFPKQYLAFYYLNIMSFAASVSIIILGANPSVWNSLGISITRNIVHINILSLIGAFFAGSYTSMDRFIYGFAIAQLGLTYFVLHFIIGSLCTTSSPRSMVLEASP